MSNHDSDLANRIASRSLARILEVAAGTGVVTRKLAPAVAYCQGTPLRSEIEALAAVDGKIQAHIVAIER
jgi:hypothetical protein